MTSPARLHRERTLARLAHEADKGKLAPLSEAKPYEMMLAKLDSDLRRLHDIQSVEKKIELKRELLPEYDGWVHGALEGGSGGQDDVLATVMVWKIDTEDFKGALDIAEYILAHDAPLPSRYQRNAPCLILEEITDAAKRALDEKRFDADRTLACEWEAVLDRAQMLTRGHDMPDQVRAKHWKVRGRMQELISDNPAVALESFRKALALDNNVGVKKEIERCERLIKNKAAAPQGEAA